MENYKTYEIYKIAGIFCKPELVAIIRETTLQNVLNEIENLKKYNSDYHFFHKEVKVN